MATLSLRLVAAIRRMMQLQNGDLLRACASYAFTAAVFHEGEQMPMNSGHEWLAHRGLDALYFGYMLDAVADVDI